MDRPQGMSIPELVHILTRDHDETAHVVDTITGARETHTVRVPGLLTELETEAGSSIASRGGSTTGPKMPISIDVVDLATRIRGELIRDLIRLGAHIRVRDLAGVLTDWWETWSLSGPGAAEHGPWEATLEAWITQIRALLDPPVTLTCPTECPICGARRILQDDTESDALTIAYRRERPIETASLICRACGPIATGGHAIRLTLNLGHAV